MAQPAEEKFLDAVVAGDEKEVRRMLRQAVEDHRHRELQEWVYYVCDAEQQWDLVMMLQDGLTMSGHHPKAVMDYFESVLEDNTDPTALIQKEELTKLARQAGQNELSRNAGKKEIIWDWKPDDRFSYDKVEPFPTRTDGNNESKGGEALAAILVILVMVGFFVLLVVPQNPDFEAHRNYEPNSSNNRPPIENRYARNPQDPKVPEGVEPASNQLADKAAAEPKSSPVTFKTRAAKYLSNQGYNNIVLEGRAQPNLCTRTEVEEVAKGVSQRLEKAYKGFNFTAKVPNTDIQLEGKVCPKPGTIEAGERNAR